MKTRPLKVKRHCSKRRRTHIIAFFITILIDYDQYFLLTSVRLGSVFAAVPQPGLTAEIRML